MALLQHMFASCATKAFSTNSAVHTQTCGKAATPYMPTKASLRDIAFFAAKGVNRNSVCTSCQLPKASKSLPLTALWPTVVAMPLAYFALVELNHIASCDAWLPLLTPCCDISLTCVLVNSLCSALQFISMRVLMYDASCHTLLPLLTPCCDVCLTCVVVFIFRDLAIAPVRENNKVPFSI